jgi:cathepsin A (carboxypeptidase C)
MPNCTSQISDCYITKRVKTCFNATIYCNENIIDSYTNYGLNIYDVRTKPNVTSQFDSDPSNTFWPFLNRIDIKEKLGADLSINFTATYTNETVHLEYLESGDLMTPYHQDVAELLNDNIPVLIYAGDADFICNWYGNKAWTLALNWNESLGFNSAHDLPLTYLSNGTEYGQYRTYKEFSFVRIYESGHMVPYYQPAAALDMISRWLRQSHF